MEVFFFVKYTLVAFYVMSRTRQSPFSYITYLHITAFSVQILILKVKRFHRIFNQQSCKSFSLQTVRAAQMAYFQLFSVTISPQFRRAVSLKLHSMMELPFSEIPQCFNADNAVKIAGTSSASPVLHSIFTCSVQGDGPG